MAAAPAAALAKAMSNTQKTYEVSRADLPVSCPLPERRCGTLTQRSICRSKPPAKPSARTAARTSCWWTDPLSGGGWNRRCARWSSGGSVTARLGTIIRARD